MRIHLDNYSRDYAIMAFMLRHKSSEHVSVWSLIKERALYNQAKAKWAIESRNSRAGSVVGARPQ